MQSYCTHCGMLFIRVWFECGTHVVWNAIKLATSAQTPICFTQYFINLEACLTQKHIHIPLNTFIWRCNSVESNSRIHSHIAAQRHPCTAGYLRFIAKRPPAMAGERMGSVLLMGRLTPAWLSAHENATCDTRI